jgi:hypothetical protein
MFRNPLDDSYRTCEVCGSDCEPEPFTIEGGGVRISFICREHGIHSVIDPFEEHR